MKTYQRIATLLQAIENCERANNAEWRERHRDTLARIMRETAPSGGGFGGTTLLESSSVARLAFSTSFHHMNDAGMYDGWTEHAVIVRPHLAHGYTLRVTGRDRNGIKDYIAETFGAWLDSEEPNNMTTTTDRERRTRMTTTKTRLTGHDAITYAEQHGIRLHKYADPTEGTRDDLTPDEARAIAAEDPSLIYIDVARR